MIQPDNKLMEESCKIAEQLQNILKKRFKDKPTEDSFQIGTYALATLLAGFIDAVIVNHFPEKKHVLADDILRLTKILLHVKETERKNTTDNKH